VVASNPNWPIVEAAWGVLWNAGGGTVPANQYTAVTELTRGTSSIGRGRQYELDQIRAGEYGLTLTNADGSLDPTNTTGPWYGHIAPYQPIRVRAQWPPTVNLLTQFQATGGDLGGYPAGTSPLPAAEGVFSNVDTTGGSIFASASPWQGSTVFRFSVPSGSTTGSRIVHINRAAGAPGGQYTAQFHIRDITSSTTLQVKPFIAWYAPASSAAPAAYTYGTTATLTGSSSASWTTLTVTGVLPAAAAGMDVGIALAADAAAACVVQVDGLQLERSGAASAWTSPGVWYPLYAGFVERWPSSWDLSGTYGLVQPTATDAFSLLSQVKLADPLTEEINAAGPRFLYKLDDPEGSTTFTDSVGAYPAAPVAAGKFGAGSLTAGNEITAASPAGVYTGSAGTVVTVNNPNPGSSTNSAASYLSLAAAGITGPANPGGSWTRIIAFRYTGPTPAAQAVIWSCMDRTRALGTPIGSLLYILVNSAGHIQFTMQGPTGAGDSFDSGTFVNDSEWHLVQVSYSHTTGTLLFGQDDYVGTWTSISPALEPVGLVTDSVGGYVDTVLGGTAAYNFQGDISFVGEFPTALSATTMGNIYTAWRSACAGESTDARYARILRYAGYTGPTSIQTGLTTAMGPCNTDGTDAVSALQQVVDTENGEHFVARDGTITFRARSARYNTTTPTYTFGERTDLGEWPYEDCSLDYDSTHLSNQVTVTQDSTGQTFAAQDAASVAAYFPRTLERGINSANSLECQDAANYLLSRYRQPAVRVDSLKLHPSAQTGLWPVCLSLELGTRIRVMRRPQGAPAIQVDCFVENIQWDVDDTGDAWVTLQCSPADLTPYGVLAAWHATLASTIASGATAITVNASQDNTNPLAVQLPAGTQLTLDPGGTNQETVTIAAVGATSPGWTTATITLTAATTKAHNVGIVVCGALPSGVTDPTTWDAVAALDSMTLPY
jgi:hypothetical protein